MPNVSAKKSSCDARFSAFRNAASGKAAVHPAQAHSPSRYLHRPSQKNDPERGLTKVPSALPRLNRAFRRPSEHKPIKSVNGVCYSQRRVPFLQRPIALLRSPAGRNVWRSFSQAEIDRKRPAEDAPKDPPSQRILQPWLSPRPRPNPVPAGTPSISPAQSALGSHRLPGADIPSYRFFDQPSVPIRVQGQHAA